MIDPTTNFGSRVLKRLGEEKVIWLTTVSPSGTPQPNPVWFYWDGQCFLIYSQPNAQKIKNIKRNPLVSLNFEGATEAGGDVVIFSGEAFIGENPMVLDTNYIEKYKQAIAEFNETPESLLAAYRNTIRVKPKRMRGF